LLSAIIVFSILVFWWWYNRKDKIAVRRMVPALLGVIILPGMLLVGLRKGTDDIVDRPTEPWGIDNHTITFETTFFPFIPPLDKAWTTILNRNKPITERVAFVGMLGLLMLPAIAFFLFRKREDEVLNKHVKVFLWAAIISWCMAAGVFYQNGFKFLWEAIPLLKQFRVLDDSVFLLLPLPACMHLHRMAYVQKTKGTRTRCDRRIYSRCHVSGMGI
jgi:hypothetical protein